MYDPGDEINSADAKFFVAAIRPSDARLERKEPRESTL
jgi:hypothetical protein